MATQPRLVNKQFNTPIGLYSQQNINEVLQREQQILANGAIGIDFNNPQVGKPANLQNSAVLRMLEEEEQRRGGRAGVKRVAWPPPQEGTPDSPYVEQNAVQAQGGPQFPNQSHGLQQNNYSPQQAAPYQQPAQPSYRPLKPLDVTSVGSGSPLISPAHSQGPHGFRPSTPSKGWAPVQSPVQSGAQKYFGAPPAQQYQSQPQYQPVSQPYPQPGQQYQAPGQAGQQYQSPSHQQYQAPSQQYQTPSQQYQTSSQQYQQPGQQYQSQSFSQAPGQQYQTPSQPASAQAQVAAPRPQTKKVEPPPSTITLRPAAPVSQAPAPVYSAQPATASLKVVVGGRNLRGDLKWPPENVKTRMQEETRQLLELAKGPACRPRRKERDYTPFFEQHALNSTYPGYKIPPGTQFYRPE